VERGEGTCGKVQVARASGGSERMRELDVEAEEY
jgi:hypothetical protein